MIQMGDRRHPQTEAPGIHPVTLGAVAVSLAMVALAACYLPARRVAGLEPAGLLRQE